MATPIPTNHAAFDLAEVAQAIGGELVGASIETRGVVVDSRAVEPGVLFVALRGERHDAHRFIRDAVERGAAGVVVARDASVDEPGVPRIVVDDTTTALGDLAALHRTRWGRTVVAITGSAGKTTTKELTAAAISASGARVHKTRGNLNNLVGVPMTILELDDSVDVAVVEMGTSQPGEIPRLAAIGRPELGVVTVVSAAHTEGLGDVERVRQEKMALIDAVQPSGTGVLDGDDDTLASWPKRAGGAARLFFGTADQCDVRVAELEVTADLSTRAVFEVREPECRLEARLELLGEAAARCAAAALAVALARGDDLEKAVRALETVAPTPGRMCPLMGDGGVYILDDSYNANPRSTALALDTGVALARVLGTRFVAVLADMKELGAVSAEEHAAVVRHAAGLGVAGLVLVGPEMRGVAGAVHGTDVLPEVHDDAVAAALALPSIVRGGDVVLVKGSRSMEMERVVDALAGDGGAR